MKILIVSDTHGRETNLRNVLKKVGPVDHLIHCGDSEDRMDEIRELAGCPTTIVRGNCDYSSRLNGFEVVELDGIRFFVTHGHRYSVSWDHETLAEAALSQGAQIALFGHTHVPCMEKREDGLTIANPGSISLPRQDGRRPSFLVAETDGKGNILFGQFYIGPGGRIGRK